MELKAKKLQNITIRTSNGLLKIVDDLDAGFNIFLNGTMIYKNGYLKCKLKNKTLTKRK